MLAEDGNIQEELLKKGLMGTGIGQEKRGSVQTVYEVQTIKVNRQGQRSYSKRMSVDQEPNEVSDILNSLHMLKMIKQNSQKQIRKYSCSNLENQ